MPVQLEPLQPQNTGATGQTANPPAAAPKRYVELDSLRGIAAFTVVVGHFAQIMLSAPAGVHRDWDIWRKIILLANRTPLCFFLNGGQAVRFFFVLSGFVLALPFLSDKQPSYRTYIVRRICRIYLPYLASLFLTLIAIQAFAGYELPGFTGAVRNTWYEAPRATLVWQHIAMIGLYAGDRYNEVYWSLIQEMRISLVFPLIALLVKRTKWWLPPVVVGVNELICLVLAAVRPSMSLDLQSLIMSLHISGIFIVGAMVAKYHHTICASIQPKRSWPLILIGTGAFLAYSMGIKTLDGAQFLERFVKPLAHSFSPGSPFNLRFLTFGFSLIADWVAVGCSVVAIYFALEIGPVHRFLNRWFLTALGKTSYSLYLVHAIVLYSLLYTLLNTKYLPLLFVFYALLVPVVTIVFYRLIEAPSIVLGKRLSRIFN